ncbi:hypothetical protein BT67DRAFT_255443 [Trichocladium antarcticum]|uniref:Uncharacterized protein n=1 Tax=Trichocladium antarcticum TaxID=1450529 RepID=A0AAN6UMV6_9PEZI|nr:hypothetical protein BT67DRAFT_255443 [Trichocladium antarcticum]
MDSDGVRPIFAAPRHCRHHDEPKVNRAKTTSCRPPTKARPRKHTTQAHTHNTCTRTRQAEDGHGLLTGASERDKTGLSVCLSHWHVLGNGGAGGGPPLPRPVASPTLPLPLPPGLGIPDIAMGPARACRWRTSLLYGEKMETRMRPGLVLGCTPHHRGLEPWLHRHDKAGRNRPVVIPRPDWGGCGCGIGWAAHLFAIASVAALSARHCTAIATAATRLFMRYAPSFPVPLSHRQPGVVLALPHLHTRTRGAGRLRRNWDHELYATWHGSRTLGLRAILSTGSRYTIYDTLCDLSH